MNKRFARSVAGLVALALAPAALHAAESFPTRPIRIIVPFPPGGGSDSHARIVAEKLTEVVGQTVIVDNRPGAGGNIGAAAAARAAPDGYTLFLCNVASHGISPAVSKKLPFDPDRDFAAVSMLGAQANVLIVHPSIPVRTVAELIAWAKAGGEGVAFASPGIGTSPDMAMELLKVSAGFDLPRVVYKGGAPAQQDVIAGHVKAMFASVGEVLGTVRSGRVRAIAVSSLARHPALPDVPTFDESGVKGYQVLSWNHLCAPAAVPEPILAALNAAVVKAVGSNEVKEKFARLGTVAEASTRVELSAFMRSELAKWRKLATTAGISTD